MILRKIQLPGANPQRYRVRNENDRFLKMTIWLDGGGAPAGNKTTSNPVFQFLNLIKCSFSATKIRLELTITTAVIGGETKSVYA